jgi:hypothetical protein
MRDAEKKRARDRRAQQNQRDKRLIHVKLVEKRISTLKNELESLRYTSNCRLLGNVAPQAHQEATALTAPVVSLPSVYHAEDVPGNYASAVSSVSKTGDVSIAQLCITDGDPLSSSASVKPRFDQHPSGKPCNLNQARESTCEEFQVVIQSAQPRLYGERIIPLWHITPLHFDTDIVVTDEFSLWNSKPDLVRASPETPQPVELLYGSKKNYLADVISKSTRPRPCRDPERLAGGWLAYRLIKWMIQPTEERFNRLYEFQKPVAEQLCHPHPYFADFAILPRFRVNLVKNQHLYNPVDVVGLLTCCLKVRWPWNKPILEPNDDGQLQIPADFLDRFTKVRVGDRRGSL